ncbi:MAG: thermonuclease family protein [Rhizobiaceae bacterium]|nr:thermonuclease family protein [Rhizobiaceae bacterium]
MNLRSLSLSIALSALVAPAPGPAAIKRVAGPVEATVLKVLDGDTFLAEAHVWPGHSVRINIRIRGIDAPEMKARCGAERIAANRARDALSGLLSAGPVLISNIAGAKYYGRVLADVMTPNGEDVAPILLQDGLVRRYGGGRRVSWCD